MTEPTTTETPADAQEPTTPQGDPADLGDAGKKALQAERSAKAAALRTAAELQAKLDKIEQASLSELEQAQNGRKAAEDQLAAITRQNLVNGAALAKGLPADLTGFITGSNEDEVNTQIDALLARLNAPTTPAPDPSQGSRSNTALNGDGIEASLKAALGIN